MSNCRSLIRPIARLFIFFGLYFISSAWAENYPLSVIDYSGHRVSVEDAPKRIVALSPHIVENLFAIGAGDLIVGALQPSTYPEEAKSIRSIGDYSAINIEEIVQLDPDLVIGWRSGNNEKTLQKIEQLGFQVYRDQPEKLEDIPRSLNDFSRLIHGYKSPLAGEFERELHALKRTYAQKPEISVFYQIWFEPLQTINVEHYISDIISLCGGRNVFANEPGLAPIVSKESVISSNPNVIIVGSSRKNATREKQLWQRWPLLNAVKNKTIYGINPDWVQKPTMRILQGTNAVCENLDRARSTIESPSAAQ